MKMSICSISLTAISIHMLKLLYYFHLLETILFHLLVSKNLFTMMQISVLIFQRNLYPWSKKNYPNKDQKREILSEFLFSLYRAYLIINIIIIRFICF